jgi:hypothetical protein
VGTDHRMLLDFHKTSDPGSIPDLAAIQIHKAMHLDLVAKPDIGCDPQCVL